MLSDKFPSPVNKVFAVQFRNDTDTNVKVILDNQAMCSAYGSRDNQYTKGDCQQMDSTVWKNSLGEFYLIDSDGKRSKQDPSQTQVLRPGEVWSVQPPVDAKTKYPYWCFDQPCNPNTDDRCIAHTWKLVPPYGDNPIITGDKGIRRNCPGVGAIVVPESSTMEIVEGTSRFEYNINNGVIWYNGSAVDGLNVNMTMHYTGCPLKVQDESGDWHPSQKQCTTPLNSCPHSSSFHNTWTCPSPKLWGGSGPAEKSDARIDQMCDKGPDEGLQPHELVGCGYGDREHKIKCHKWWAKNKECAQKWLNFLQKTKGHTCDQYGWAYDEKKYNDGDTFDENGNPGDNKSVSPLVRCDLKPNTALNIAITDIM